MFVYEMRKGKSGNSNAAKTVVIQSLHTLTAFSPQRFLLNTRNLIKESLGYSRKIFDILKCCVCVARYTAVSTL